MESQKNDDRERRGKRREPQYSPLIMATNTLGAVSSSAYTFSQCELVYWHHTDVQMLSAP